MKHIKKLLLLSAVVGLFACIGNSSEYVTYYLNKGFDGRPANQFFYIYGPPSAKFEQINGGTAYRWTTTKESPYAIPHSGQNKMYASPTEDYKTVDTYSPGIKRQYCELRIDSDQEDIIRNISIAVDTIGRWSTSRCSEIFNKVYP